MSLPYAALAASDSSATDEPGARIKSHCQRSSHTIAVKPGSANCSSAVAPPQTAGSKTMPHHGRSYSREEYLRHKRRPSNGKTLEDGEPCSMDFCPEDLAAQLTLLDQVAFRSIGPDELTSCSWNKKNKLAVAPNVVALTRRFNHVSFWTVEEILKKELPKQRGEVMAHFVRIAKRLNELNNLHSEFAILSGLQSVPVYRLGKTWSCLPKKERQMFEKLKELFSEKENFSRLREHMDGIALKHQACVPYLGLYLTDIVHIDMAHPHSGGLESQQRQFKMNNILRIVSELQQSLYSNLFVSPECQRYLDSIRYIDELQKFVEDDQWKRSLHIEPDEHSTYNQVVKEAAPHLRDQDLVAELNLSPAKGMGCMSQGQKKFVPGHRKSRSDGSSIFFACGRLALTGSNDTMSQSEKSEDSQSSGKRLHLLDGSLIDSPRPESYESNEKIIEDTTIKKSSLDKSLIDQISRITLQDRCIFQSMIRRKALIKEGKRLTMSGWQRYWIELWGSTLVYYPPKTITKSNDRKDYKSDPCKCQCISGWFVMIPDSPHVDTCCFQLTDPVRKNVYKFRANSMDVTQIWIHSLQEGTQAELARQCNTNLISFE